MGCKYILGSLFNYSGSNFVTGVGENLLLQVVLLTREKVVSINKENAELQSSRPCYVDKQVLYVVFWFLILFFNLPYSYIIWDV